MPVKADIKELLAAGAHFGHKTSRWHPKMAPYIHSRKNGAHIINLEKTVEALEEALPKLTEIAGSGKKILFVGTKKQMKEIIKNNSNKTKIKKIFQVISLVINILLITSNFVNTSNNLVNV